MFTSTSTTTGQLWNGPICQTCGTRYLGHHSCSEADLLRRIAELYALMNRQPDAPMDRTRTCPCRPENGGSGVCGCILSGPQITC